MNERLLVSVVDDDESVRESLPDLIREFGFEAAAYESAEAFLESSCVMPARCLVLDLAMPGLGGRGLAYRLRQNGIRIPIVFITASHDSAVRAELLNDGAVACLYKPFSDIELYEALVQAIEPH